MEVETAPSSAPTPPTTSTPRGGGAGGEGVNSATASSGLPARSIKIHPLAIIGISDHHTRVVTGGSALPKEAPVVGLLFGYYLNDGSSGSGKYFCSFTCVQ